MGGSLLKKYGSYIHFTEEELAPGHTYRLRALAMQKDLATTTTHLMPQLANGSKLEELLVSLRQPSAARSSVAKVPYAAILSQPLDTLWHTLTTVVTPADSMPKTSLPAMLTPAKCFYKWQRNGSISTNGQETVTLEKNEPTYATVALIRDTKHLNITLRALNDNAADNQVVDTDYSVEIIDNNAHLDCNNNLIHPEDTIKYTPCHQWTTSFTGTDGVVGEKAAHYDLMFNRLLYKNASVDDDQYAILNEEDIAKARNALLVIRKVGDDEASGRKDGDIIFAINLPYILSSCRTWAERYYHYQEYLDREYDYRLQFILKGGRIEEIQYFIGLELHNLPWAMRTQNHILE
jgi:hypothetical protein